MSNEITPFQPGQLSNRFADQPLDNSLGAGISGGFAVVGFRGKVWTPKYKGEEHPLMREDGDGPRNSLDVVILSAPKVVSKIFYVNGYVEGSTEPPDCWSTDGATPDAAAANRQADVCAVCPHNQWGSRMSADGKRKGKACSDSKRLAIVPANAQANDAKMMRNEMWGGPMLLRVPAASLQDLAKYGERLKAQGYPPQSVVTRIKFDPAQSYPKMQFEPLRPVTDDEADAILELAASDQVKNILAEDHGSKPVAEAPQTMFTAPLPGQVAQAAPTGKVVPIKQTGAKAGAKAAATTTAAATSGDEASVSTAGETGLAPDFEQELDGLLAK